MFKTVKSYCPIHEKPGLSIAVEPRIHLETRNTEISPYVMTRTIVNGTT